MSSSVGNRGPLEPETWRRIGAVLDRVSEIDLRARPEALTEACEAEGVRVSDVEPYLGAAERSDEFLEHLGETVIDGAMRGLVGETRAPRLNTGDRVGPYEIVAALGAGGMGEVYEARDTRLGRTVALKFLNADLATRPEARQRFEREARAISSLNHPHVCTLYDISHHNDVAFLVMELVEGETLAARLQHRGALPLGDALTYAAQIGDALGAAHRQGVVHRDLKPANVMLTPRGVKLLDFGLAALRTPQPLIDGGSDPTLTVEGRVLGTLAYMAPEQLQGKPADARADIFALGAVMHEMLTGRRAFEAGSSAGVIAAVLERDPGPVANSRPDVPLGLDATIRTCLAKDPDERWQSAADVRHRLREIASAPSDLGARATRRSSRRLALALGLVSVAAAMTGALLWKTWRGSSAPALSPVVRFELPPPEGLAYDRMHALSPDGTRIAFVAGDSSQRALWARALDSTSPQRLAGTEDASYPFWSPDGRFIGFFASNALKKIELATGTAETICNCETGTGGGATWNRDGVIVYSKGLVVSPLWRVHASGGTPVAVTPQKPGPSPGPNSTSTNAWPQFLPDGKHFLWMSGRAGDVPGVRVGNIDTGDQKQILEYPRALTAATDVSRGWYVTGHLFFLREHALMAQRFSVERLELVGEPIRVAEQVEQTAPGRSFFDVAAGVLAYRAPDTPASARLAWLDRTGREIASLGDAAPYAGVAVSSDGRYVIASGAPGLVRIDTASGIPTPTGLLGQSPVWEPTGKRFALSGGRRAGPLASIASVATPDDVKVLNVGLTGQSWPSDWSKDGRFIAGTVLNADTLMDLWAADISENPMTLRYLIRAPGNQQDQRISPDGRWVAYASDERSQRHEIYVRRFPEGPGIWRVSTAGGRLPSWSPDGRELLYVSPEGGLLRVGVATDAEFSATTPQLLFQHEALRRSFNRGAQFGRFYDVVDGRRILLRIPTADRAPAPITVVLNWQRLVAQADGR